MRWVSRSATGGARTVGRRSTCRYVGGQHVRSGDGVDLWYDPVPEDDVVVVDGIRVTDGFRTTLDRMRRVGDVREAVVAADQMSTPGW